MDMYDIINPDNKLYIAIGLVVLITLGFIFYIVFFDDNSDETESETEPESEPEPEPAPAPAPDLDPFSYISGCGDLSSDDEYVDANVCSDINIYESDGKQKEKCGEEGRWVQDDDKNVQVCKWTNEVGCKKSKGFSCGDDNDGNETDETESETEPEPAPAPAPDLDPFSYISGCGDLSSDDEYVDANVCSDINIYESDGKQKEKCGEEGRWVQDDDKNVQVCKWTNEVGCKKSNGFSCGDDNDGNETESETEPEPAPAPAPDLDPFSYISGCGDLSSDDEYVDANVCSDINIYESDGKQKEKCGEEGRWVQDDDKNVQVCKWTKEVGCKKRKNGFSCGDDNDGNETDETGNETDETDETDFETETETDDSDDDICEEGMTKKKIKKIWEKLRAEAKTATGEDREEIKRQIRRCVALRDGDGDNDGNETDDSDWFVINNKGKPITCAQVARNPGRRCGLDGAADACAATCKNYS
ncbi:hypothetical protein MKD35_69 [Aureococcus anophagefferens virus]|nr:hypothetical protein MKD35_69 [Aureococcus anophagefferens virus]